MSLRPVQKPTRPCRGRRIWAMQCDIFCLPTEGGLCPGGEAGRCPEGVSGQGGSLSRWGVSVQVRSLCPGGRSLSRWGGGSLSRWGEILCPGGFSVQESLCQGDPRRVTCGRYASYWNAFLLIYLFSIFTKYDTKLIKKNKNRRPFHHFP